MSIEEIESEIVEEFEIFGEDWEGKYEHLIELGKSLPLIEEKFKTEDRIIKGCQSKVWMHSEVKDGKIVSFIVIRIPLLLLLFTTCCCCC